MIDLILIDLLDWAPPELWTEQQLAVLAFAVGALVLAVLVWWIFGNGRFR